MPPVIFSWLEIPQKISQILPNYKNEILVMVSIPFFCRRGPFGLHFDERKCSLFLLRWLFNADERAAFPARLFRILRTCLRSRLLLHIFLMLTVVLFFSGWVQARWTFQLCLVFRCGRRLFLSGTVRAQISLKIRLRSEKN